MYEHIRSGGCGFYEQPRGLIAVWGKEAVQFLNGMITNDVAKLEDGGQMLAAFPNAQGRLLALVRVLRHGDRFLFETEEATHETLYNNLFRFTFAGDFFVEELSEGFSYFEIFGPNNDVYNPHVGEKFAGAFALESAAGAAYFIPNELANDFRRFLSDENGCLTITDELYETLRIESGIPRYGVDMDETTIVPELGLEGLISYNKGCYIGQEIIARIHFRGHVAKQLTGLVLEALPQQQAETRPVGSVPLSETELKTTDGKNAGRITSVTYSPGLEKSIALAYVRYDYLADGTELKNAESVAVVQSLPFIDRRVNKQERG
jgi:folate-binding protein YgfZ